MAADDLDVLTRDLRSRVRASPNGEVSWHVSDALRVLEQLADAGRVVHGLDIRDYDSQGRFIETAFSTYAGDDPIAARDSALYALSQGDLPGEWVLIGW